jgi:hypothetical protein
VPRRRAMDPSAQVEQVGGAFVLPDVRSARARGPRACLESQPSTPPFFPVRQSPQIDRDNKILARSGPPDRNRIIPAQL